MPHADDSGRYEAQPLNPPAPPFLGTATPAPVSPPSPSQADGLWWKLALFLAPVIFAAGGAWVQIANVEGQVKALEGQLSAHRAAGHSDTRSRIDLLERQAADLANDRAIESARLDQKLDVIRDNLAALCAAQRPNPCRRPAP